MKTLLFILFLGCSVFFVFFSCGNHEAERLNLSQKDSSDVMQVSIQSVFDKEKGRINTIYYDAPIMLITSGISKQEHNLIINGKETQFLSKSPIGSEIKWKNPDPVVEVFSFDIQAKDTCKLEIRLPMSGLLYRVAAIKNDGDRWGTQVNGPVNYK